MHFFGTEIQIRVLNWSTESNVGISLLNYHQKLYLYITSVIVSNQKIYLSIYIFLNCPFNKILKVVFCLYRSVILRTYHYENAYQYIKVQK